MTFAIQKKILRLKISVHDRFRVQVVEGGHDFRRVEVTGRVVEPSRVTQVGEQLTAAYKLQQHVEESVIVVGPEPGEEMSVNRETVVGNSARGLGDDRYWLRFFTSTV